MKTLPIKALRAALDYDPDTGKITCRKTGKPKMATRASTGRFVGRVLQTQMYAHRVAWALYYGWWPVGEIDHINGDEQDNRIVNLRDVDRATNRRNAKLHCSNRSGTTGVCFDKKSGKWQAQIKFNKKMKYLGQFDDLADAVAARKAAERALGFHENHGRAA